MPGLDLDRLTNEMDRHMPQLAWPGQNYARELTHKPWFKSFHSLAPDFVELARHPKLLQLVHDAFPDRPTKLWGVAPLVKQAGAVHRWHSDIETRCWPTLTVWVGLKGVNKSTSLQVISHTHKLAATPDVLRNKGIPMQSSEDVLKAAKELNPACELIVPEMTDGDCIAFFGTLWHGTHNTSSNARYAVTIQYSEEGAEVQVPMNFEKPVQWHNQQPCCYPV